MRSHVIITGPRTKAFPTKGPSIVINTTSTSKDPLWKQLSPFYLGPCELWGGHTAKNVENAWQYSKVYQQHQRVNTNSHPYLPKWLPWAAEGWNNLVAVRYPMGKGATPLFSYWDGKEYNYLEARRKIYIPLYADAVKKTKAWKTLKQIYREGEKTIVLWDFDGYDHERENMTLIDVMLCSDRKMGHAFVLKMMLVYGTNFYKH